VENCITNIGIIPLKRDLKRRIFTLSLLFCIDLRKNSSLEIIILDIKKPVNRNSKELLFQNNAQLLQEILKQYSKHEYFLITITKLKGMQNYPIIAISKVSSPFLKRYSFIVKLLYEFSSRFFKMISSEVSLILNPKSILVYVVLTLLKCYYTLFHIETIN